MRDKERIIQRLQSQIAVCHEIDSDWISLTVGMGKKLVEMLKEDEAVKPKMLANYRHACGACNQPLWVANQRYCASCGRRVDWDG